MREVPTPRIGFSCAVPKTATPSQCAAVASQKTTWPRVTLVVTGPEEVVVPVAVRVVTVPAVTLFEDTAKAVVVKGGAPSDADGTCAKTAATTMSYTRVFLPRAVPCERFGARV